MKKLRFEEEKETWDLQVYNRIYFLGNQNQVLLF